MNPSIMKSDYALGEVYQRGITIESQLLFTASARLESVSKGNHD